MRILCDAVPFGFGPVSKLIAVVKELSKNGHDFVFVGKGCSLELAETSGVFTIIESIDTLHPENSKRLSHFKNQECHAALSVMNPPFVEWAINNGIRTVVIDSLFAMWDEVPKGWLLSDGIILQRLDGVEQRALVELSQKQHTVVGPILDPLLTELQKSQSQSNSILVNLGGAEDPISEIDYVCADAVSNLLAGLPIWSKFERKTLAVGPKQRHRLKSLEADGFKVLTMTRSEFLKELSSSDVFLTTPGLTAAFESFSLATPCAFLPPFNYSQFLNLDEFRRVGVAPQSIHWRDCGLGKSICPRLEETTAVRHIEQLIIAATHNAGIVNSLRSALSDVVSETYHSGRGTLSSKQHQYFEALGGIGTKSATEFIWKVLNG